MLSICDRSAPHGERRPHTLAQPVEAIDNEAVGVGLVLWLPLNCVSSQGESAHADARPTGAGPEQTFEHERRHRRIVVEALDAELERETRAFFAREENFRIDAGQRTVWLSELLNFYPEDFVPQPAASLLAYANRYVLQPAPLDFKVRFTPYDWTVANSRRQR